MLSGRDITVSAGARRILDGVDVDVAFGAVTAVVGRNGAGKSTLLRVLSGELSPGRGQVTMNGTPLTSWSVRDRACVRAVLSQATDVAFPLSALEIVLLARIPHNGGTESGHDRAIARAALRATDAEPLAERGYDGLSGGERQRVQLARAIAQIWEAPPGAPRYLLLDEPTAALDLSHQHACLALARSLARDGVGVLAILHDLNLAARYADRIVVLDDGAVAADGDAEAVITAEVIRRAFRIDASILRHPTSGCAVVVTNFPER